MGIIAVFNLFTEPFIHSLILLFLASLTIFVGGENVAGGGGEIPDERFLFYFLNIVFHSTILIGVIFWPPKSFHEWGILIIGSFGIWLFWFIILELLILEQLLEPNKCTAGNLFLIENLTLIGGLVGSIFGRWWRLLALFIARMIGGGIIKSGVLSLLYPNYTGAYNYTDAGLWILVTFLGPILLILSFIIAIFMIPSLMVSSITVTQLNLRDLVFFLILAIGFIFLIGDILIHIVTNHFCNC